MSEETNDLTIYTFRADSPTFRPAYTCSLPGNNHGDYVRLKDYEAQSQQIAKLEAEKKALKEGMKGDYDLDMWLEWNLHKRKLEQERRELAGIILSIRDSGTVQVTGGDVIANVSAEDLYRLIDWAEAKQIEAED